MKNLQILNVLLWQKNGKVRNLPFLQGHVNVITGDAGKGKSSILHIIDYCLLSSESKGISRANIDSKVNWYGLRLRTSEGIFTVARPSQTSSEVTQAYFNAEGDIPEIPNFNIRIDNLKRVLNGALGVDSDLRIPYGGKYIRAGSKVSFRSFLPHCYQDQNTITSPEYLYIRPSDKKYQERIERTFRMALGIESAKVSVIKAKLAELEVRKTSIERKQEAHSKNKFAFSYEIASLHQEAQMHGFLPESNNESSEIALTDLRQLVSTQSTPGEVRREIELLESEIFKLRSKNRSYQAFIQANIGNTAGTKDVEDALRPVEIINDSADSIFPTTLANLLINRLSEELKAIRSRLKQKNLAPFIKEVQDLIDQNTQELDTLEKRVRTVRANSSIKTSPSEYYRYLGRLEAKIGMYATNIEEVEDFGEDEVDTQIEALRKEIEQDNIKIGLWERKLDELINGRLSRLRLKGYEGFSAIFNERAKLINLASKDLSVIEKMPDIGSASNYLYLHLAYFLSVHEIAKINSTPWMPSFLVLDQPSTPYFSTTGEAADDIKSLDVALIEMNRFVKEMDKYGGFQIILLEHIEKSHWEKLKLDRFNLVDRELRGNYGLILE